MKSILMSHPTSFGLTMVAFINFGCTLGNGWELNLCIAIVCLYFRMVLVKTWREKDGTAE